MCSHRCRHDRAGSRPDMAPVRSFRRSRGYYTCCTISSWPGRGRRGCCWEGDNYRCRKRRACRLRGMDQRRARPRTVPGISCTTSSWPVPARLFAARSSRRWWNGRERRWLRKQQSQRRLGRCTCYTSASYFVLKQSKPLCRLFGSDWYIASRVKA